MCTIAFDILQARNIDEDYIIRILLLVIEYSFKNFIVIMCVSSLLTFPPRPQGEQEQLFAITWLEQENERLLAELATR